MPYGGFRPVIHEIIPSAGPQALICPGRISLLLDGT